VANGGERGRKWHLAPRAEVPRATQSKDLAGLTALSARIEAERQFAALANPQNTLQTVVAAWDRDREARIRLGLPLINDARAAAEAGEGA